MENVWDPPSGSAYAVYNRVVTSLDIAFFWEFKAACKSSRWCGGFGSVVCGVRDLPGNPPGRTHVRPV